MNDATTALYRAVELARLIVGAGHPMDVAVHAASSALGTSATLTGRFTRHAIDGVAQARAALGESAERRARRVQPSTEDRSTTAIAAEENITP
jgi:hypothetical protein